MSTPTKAPTKKTPTKKTATKKAPTKKTPAKRTTVPAPTATPSSTTALDALAAPPAAQQVREISIDLIDPHPDNPRTDLGDLTELVDSIRAHGIRQNLVLVPHPDATGRYRTVIGHRRHAAAKETGLATVPAVVDHDLDERAQLELMLLENIQRSDLTPIEEAQGYQGLLDLGSTVADVARKVGRSRKTVEARLVLVKLPERAREVVHSHQATLADAELLAQTLARPEVQADPESAEAIEAAFGEPRFEHFVQQALGTLQDRAERAALYAEIEASGDTIVELGPNDYSAPRGIAELTRLADPNAKIKDGMRPALTVDEHRPCPGHVVWIYNYRNTMAYGCKDWKKHGHVERYGSSTSSKPASTEDRCEVIQNNKAAVAAETVRRRWLTGYLKPGRRLDASAVVHVATVLQMLPSSDYRDDGIFSSLFPDVLKDAARATPAGATLYLAALAATRVESQMPKDYWRESIHSKVIAAHLKTLASWGYELSELEQQYVKKHARKGA